MNKIYPDNINLICRDILYGTDKTLAVAKRLNRQYLGCNINSKAVEITKNRIDEK